MRYFHPGQDPVWPNSRVLELTRRNLLVLVHKLGDPGSAKTVGDPDGQIKVRAVEDDEHYSDRPPGEMYIPNVLDGQFVEDQADWSVEVHGPGDRLLGVLDHIRKELVEVAAAPDDITEWADVLLLALNGARRQGHSGQAIIDAVVAKHAVNVAREWPDWRTQPQDKAIGHVKVSQLACPHNVPNFGPPCPICDKEK